MNQRFLHRSGPQLGRVDGDHVYNSSGSQLGVLTVSVFTVDLARLWAVLMANASMMVQDTKLVERMDYAACR